MTSFLGSHKIEISNYSLKQVNSQGLDGKCPKKDSKKI